MEPALSILDYAKIDDIRVLREALQSKGQKLTTENALSRFRAAWKMRPAEWTITPEELPALWQAMVIEK